MFGLNENIERTDIEKDCFVGTIINMRITRAVSHNQRHIRKTKCHRSRERRKWSRLALLRLPQKCNLYDASKSSNHQNLGPILSLPAFYCPLQIDLTFITVTPKEAQAF